jgi:hypothetical protein
MKPATTKDINHVLEWIESFDDVDVRRLVRQATDEFLERLTYGLNKDEERKAREALKTAFDHLRIFLNCTSWKDMAALFTEKIASKTFNGSAPHE